MIQWVGCRNSERVGNFGGQATYLGLSQSAWSLEDLRVSTQGWPLEKQSIATSKVGTQRQDGQRLREWVIWAGGKTTPVLLSVCLVSGRVGSHFPCWMVGHCKQESTGLGYGCGLLRLCGSLRGRLTLGYFSNAVKIYYVQGKL